MLLQTLNHDIEMAAAYCSPTALSANSIALQHELSPSRDSSRHLIVERRPSVYNYVIQVNWHKPLANVAKGCIWMMVIGYLRSNLYIDGNEPNPN